MLHCFTCLFPFQLALSIAIVARPKDKKIHDGNMKNNLNKIINYSKHFKDYKMCVTSFTNRVM